MSSVVYEKLSVYSTAFIFFSVVSCQCHMWLYRASLHSCRASGAHSHTQETADDRLILSCAVAALRRVHGSLMFGMLWFALWNTHDVFASFTYAGDGLCLNFEIETKSNAGGIIL